jgi:hypothetical protein
MHTLSLHSPAVNHPNDRFNHRRNETLPQTLGQPLQTLKRAQNDGSSSHFPNDSAVISDSRKSDPSASFGAEENR